MSIIFDPVVTADLHALFGAAGLASLQARFLDDLPARPAAIVAALEDGDVARARAVAHHLKGGALAIGALGIAAAAGRVEHAEPAAMIDAVEALLALTARATA